MDSSSKLPNLIPRAKMASNLLKVKKSEDIVCTTIYKQAIKGGTVKQNKTGKNNTTIVPISMVPDAMSPHQGKDAHDIVPH